MCTWSPYFVTVIMPTFSRCASQHFSKPAGCRALPWEEGGSNDKDRVSPARGMGPHIQDFAESLVSPSPSRPCLSPRPLHSRPAGLHTLGGRGPGSATDSLGITGGRVPFSLWASICVAGNEEAGPDGFIPCGFDVLQVPCLGGVSGQGSASMPGRGAG